MREITSLSKNVNMYVNGIFIFLLLSYAALGWFLVWHIPYTFPFGGPDEPMHLSMACQTS